MDDLFWNRMIFEGISEKSRYEIEKMPKKICSYKSKELIQEVGEDIDSVCIILSGALKSTEYTADGRELNSSYYFAGDAFPFYLIYGGVKKTFYNTIALKKSEVVWLPMDELVKIVDSDQTFLHNILRFVAEYCCYSKLILRCIQYKRIKERLCYWLLYLNDSSKDIAIPESQSVLADILCVNRSSLNQELKIFENDGYIKIYKKKIKILNKNALEALL